MGSCAGQFHIGTFFTILIIYAFSLGVSIGIIEHSAKIAQEFRVKEIEFTLKGHFETEQVHVVAIQRAYHPPLLVHGNGIGQIGKVSRKLTVV